MAFPKILKNAIKCKTCGDIIESKSTHDFVTCSCQTCSVDGGLSYLRRCAPSREAFEELSEFEKADENKQYLFDKHYFLALTKLESGAFLYVCE